MTDNEAIEYLEKLEVGNFLTINIPIIGDEKISVTAMYMGKDKSSKLSTSIMGSSLSEDAAAKAEQVKTEAHNTKIKNRLKILTNCLCIIK